MIYLTAETEILLAIEPVNFRKQIDGLVALCEQQLEQEPRLGTLFVFINKARTMIRTLRYYGNGYWLATKRLSKGRYQSWPSDNVKLCNIQASELMKVLQHKIYINHQTS